MAATPIHPAWMEEKNGRVVVHLLVQPRASRDEIAGLRDDRLKVRLKAPPVDGEANAALLAFLARRLGAPKSALTLVAGQTGRRKTVAVEGVPAAAVEALLQGQKQ
ncbi:MAG: YggU family protein [Myxococcales bacterium]|nr:MAG: YggU family protein [Myxococcales bacterium]